MAAKEDELETILRLQQEELEALSAIYAEDFVLEQAYGEDYGLYPKDKDSSTTFPERFPVMPAFSIAIRPDNNEENEILKDVARSRDSEARLIISFQPGYPTLSPPKYQLSIPWIRGNQKQAIAAALEELYLNHLGESIVYIWVEKLRELLREEWSSHRIADGDNHDHKDASRSASIGNTVAPSTICVTGTDPISSEGKLIDRFSNSLAFNPKAISQDENESKQPCHFGQSSSHDHIEIRTGAPLTDRKSTFQAHVAPVSQVADIRRVLDTLYQNKKIASATHNMYAYRILRSDSKTWLQDCDDDGETHAGSRLLHLLQILDCKNVLVVVSRWYGGIQLHADRFKHINNVARQALSEFGFLSPTDGRKQEDSKIKKDAGKR